MCYLPHRQLRKDKRRRGIADRRYLPHRQLRNSIDFTESGL